MESKSKLLSAKIHLLKWKQKVLKIVELTIEKGNYDCDLDEEEIHSLYILKGTLKINEEDVNKDDFIRIIDVPKMKIESNGDAKIFMISSPKDVLYKTYAELMQERMYR